MKKLTKNELKFVEEYISNGYNGSRAYRVAYQTDNNNLSKSEAWSMLRKQHIQDAISASEKSCRQIAREIDLDRRRILLELKKIIKGDYNAKERLAGINTLCKLTGAFSPTKTEVEFEFIEKNSIDYSKLSKKEVRALQESLLAEM